MSEHEEHDEYRKDSPTGQRWAEARIGDQALTVILGYDDLRRAARDWSRFSSNTPFRVPIPEESALRPVRQLPIECDPPEHGAYRQLVADRFSRAAAAAHRPRLVELVDELLDRAGDRGRLVVVDELALPVVCHAIALTLGRPDDAERFASWGLHVFVDPADGERRANPDLDAYLAERTDAALASAGDDLFGDLARARIDDRALTRDEILGFGYLVLAGGRDTVIATIAGAVWFLASHPAEAARLRREPDRIPTAVEELIRFLSPLPHIGRTLATDASIDTRRLERGELVSLSFAAANRDPAVFDDPHTCRLDRRPNRHVGFGHGPHTCLGAPLARMELAVVLECLVSRPIELISPRQWEPEPQPIATSGTGFPPDLVIAVSDRRL